MLLDSLISEIRCGVEAVASRNWSSVTRYPARSWPGERPGRRIAADRCCPAGRGAEARTAGHRRHLGNAEEFPDQMFRVRHGLLAVRDMGTLSREICGRKATLEVSGAGRGQAQLTDIAGQFQRIAAIADGQKDYLQGVIQSYQTRTNTKMTVASERLAVIAAATPAPHRPALGARHERQRQHLHILAGADRTPGGHARDVGHHAPLGQGQGWW